MSDLITDGMGSKQTLITNGMSYLLRLVKKIELLTPVTFVKEMVTPLWKK
jgi:hypothetical protein